MIVSDQSGVNMDASMLAPGGARHQPGFPSRCPVAAFAFELENGSCFGNVARPDTMVTVADASESFALVDSADELLDHVCAATDDDMSIGELLVDEVEFAEILVVNEADRVDLSRGRDRSMQIGSARKILRIARL